jgi:hypothetical protein
MIRETWKLALPAFLSVAILIGCSKTEEEPAPPVTPPVKKSTPAPPTDSVKPKPTTPAVRPTVPPSKSVMPPLTKPVAPPAPTLSPAEAAREIAALESTYVATPDFSKRVQTIYKISDLGTPEAITVLGRLFHQEKDSDLKTEVIDSLFDIDGLDERKIAILTAGAGADQPKNVRESAIDALGDIEAKYALPILQSLASDPDEDIRDAAKDQIEMLQAEQALQK